MRHAQSKICSAHASLNSMKIYYVLSYQLNSSKGEPPSELPEFEPEFEPEPEFELFLPELEVP